ncbi:MAG: hypothetical protein KDK91_08065, partial [Gammaproteobacteria bacterium]|nr:hypothetical protein [Gammaproteobacteria bacterium]
IGRWWRDDRLRLLMLFSLPFLALIMLQSLLSRAFYNWAAPTYAAASIAITAWLCAPSTTQASIPAQDTAPDSARGERSWLWRAAVALNLVLCVAIYHYDGVARVVGIELGARADLYSRLRGWSEAGAALDRLLDSTPNSPIIFDDRKTMAALLYYAPRARGRGHMWNPDGRITDHYRFRVDARQVLGQAVVLVVQHLPREYLAERFSQLTEAGTIRIRTHPDAIRELRVYTAERFEHY